MSEPAVLPPGADVRRRILARARPVLPWLVAIGVFAWLLRRIPVDDLASAFTRVPAGPYLALVAGYSVALLVADALAVWAVFRHSLPDVPLRYADVLRLRGASLLLAVVNYGVGQGSIAFFLHRRYGTPGARAAGAVLLNAGVSVLVVTLTAGLGIAIGGAPSSRSLTLLLVALACAFPVYLLVIRARPPILRRLALLDPLFQAGVRGHLVGLLARLPHMAVLLLANALAFRLFGIRIPPGQVMTLMPLVFVVGVLPISPSGLGTVQATAVALFAAFAPGATLAARQGAVLAASVSFHFLALIATAILGALFLRRLSTVVSLSPGGAKERR